jgi:hypothetical protein
MKKNIASRTLLKISALAAAMTAFGTVEAAWEFIPEIGLTAQSNNNPRLEPDYDDSSGNSNLSVQATLSTLSERSRFYVRPRIESSRYAESEFEDLESDDYYLRVSGEYQWPTSRLGFDADLRSEAVIASEVLNVIPSDPDVPDLIDSEPGRIVFANQDREVYVIQPYFETDFSERSNFRVGARYLETDYTGGDAPGFDRTDYSDASMNLTYTRERSERTNLSARLYASQYETDAQANTTDTLGIEGVLRRSLSEPWTLELGLGFEHSDFHIDSIVATASSDENPTFRLALQRRTQLATLNLNVGRRVAPSSSGFVMELTELYIYSRQQTSQRMAVFGGLRMGEAETIGTAGADNDRAYSRFDIGLEWRVARRLYVQLEYIRAYERYSDALSLDASSEMGSVNLVYRGESRR